MMNKYYNGSKNWKRSFIQVALYHNGVMMIQVALLPKKIALRKKLNLHLLLLSQVAVVHLVSVVIIP